ncbi:hypothetical protein HDV00_009082 [Rhizophlyctis rosea]|nr:hypothetical protein HDV00_009082 [Rhizophlyctis rosea]
MLRKVPPFGGRGFSDCFPHPEQLKRVLKLLSAKQKVVAFDLQWLDDWEELAPQHEDYDPTDGPNFRALDGADELWWSQISEYLKKVKQLFLIMPSGSNIGKSDILNKFIKACPKTEWLDIQLPPPGMFRRLIKDLPSTLTQIGTAMRQNPWGWGDPEGSTCPFKQLKDLSMDDAYPELAEWFVAAKKDTLEKLFVDFMTTQHVRVGDVPVQNQLPSGHMRAGPQFKKQLEKKWKGMCPNLKEVEIILPRGGGMAMPMGHGGINPAAFQAFCQSFQAGGGMQ